MTLEPKQSISFEGKNPKFTAKAGELLPWLVKYAEAGNTVEYGVLGDLVGVNPHTQLKHILSIIGDALKKADPDIPMIQLIVINKKKGVVGNEAFGWLVPKEQIPTLSQEQKELLCKGAQKKVFDWCCWQEVLERCHLEPLSLGAPLNSLIQQAAASIPKGGEEGDDHRMLKEYVKAYPGCIGLKQQFTKRSTETPMLSGDEMDVFFESPTEEVCVEVKGKNSPEGDIRRGIFQCVKYRAILQAQQLYQYKTKKITVYLVLATDLSEELKQVADLLKIPVKANTVVPASFVVLHKSSQDTCGSTA